MTHGGETSVVDDLVEAFAARREAGEGVTVEAFAAGHPEHADELRKLLPLVCALGDIGLSGRTSQAPAELGTLGDFRLIREVGRGGMGVVYEAEQISLARRVAVKVLPFAALMDPRALQRFHNEARAAACLNHPNIVPVYFVGHERGVHFYAMQLIEGRSLAELIAHPGGAVVGEPTAPYAVGRALEDTRPAAADVTGPPRPDAAHFRRVAEWGVQAASALEYAHSLGIIHRDVKPANLMIDSRGGLWVADFGLARTAAETGLTAAGDLLGTLRYMSPEQAQAEHRLVDQRSDVYSLGVTLYELLAGRPAVVGEGRAEILHAVLHGEPPRLSSLARSIPADLETVIHKALAKEPAERYANARDLGDDLRRFLEDRPVLARRPSVIDLAARWARQRIGVLAAGIGVLLLAVAGLAVSVALLADEQGRTRAEAKAKDEAMQAKEGALRKATQEQAAAEAHLREALTLAAEHANWASQLMSSGDRPKAREAALRLAGVLRAGIQRFPDDVRDHKELLNLPVHVTHLLESLHEYEEAVPFAEFAIHSADKFFANPANAAATPLATILQDRADLCLYLADLLAACGRDGEAIKAYEDCRAFLRRHRQLLGTARPSGPDLASGYFRRLMKIDSEVGTIHLEAGRIAEGEACFRRSLATWKSEEEAEGSPVCAGEHVRAVIGLGEALWLGGRRPAAAVAFQEARSLFEKRYRPHPSRFHAWPLRTRYIQFLATCPEPSVRDPAAARKAAQVADSTPVKGMPADCGLLLGAVFYATGELAEAAAALERRVKQPGVGTAEDFYLLSIVCARRGDAKAAEHWYGRAAEWAARRRPRALLLQRLRAEAAALQASKKR